MRITSGWALLSLHCFYFCSYVTLGGLFMLIVRYRYEASVLADEAQHKLDIKNREKLGLTDKDEPSYLPDEAVGLPKQFGLFYAVVSRWMALVAVRDSARPCTISFFG
jgi:hypothetical protein